MIRRGLASLLVSPKPSLTHEHNLYFIPEKPIKRGTELFLNYGDAFFVEKSGSDLLFDSRSRKKSSRKSKKKC